VSFVDMDNADNAISGKTGPGNVFIHYWEETCITSGWTWIIRSINILVIGKLVLFLFWRHLGRFTWQLKQ